MFLLAQEDTQPGPGAGFFIDHRKPASDHRVDVRHGPLVHAIGLAVENTGRIGRRICWRVALR
jgi:hypothetical protein